MWQHIEKSEKGHWNPEGGNIGPNAGPRHFAEQFSIFGRFVAERLGDFKRKNWRFSSFFFRETVDYKVKRAETPEILAVNFRKKSQMSLFLCHQIDSDRF